MPNRIHYNFIAYEKMDGVSYIQPVELNFDMYAFDEEAALKMAKSMVSRPFYVVRKISTCSS